MPEIARGRVVALLGTESTGKTTLSHALALSLRAAGHDAVVVAEYLREFCDRAARTPTPDEQRPIAREQARRIEAAAARHAIVLADTTPLMTAVYSHWVFADTALYDEALAWQRAQVDCTLVTGLDLPWLPDGLQRDGPHVREPIDALLREALARAGIAHAVVYGEDEARTRHALTAVCAALGLPLPDENFDARSSADGAPFSRWRARCSECLQPDCEHLRGSAARR